MLKHSFLAAISIAALTIAPIPVISGAALAQRSTLPPCTAGPNCPGSGPDTTTYQCSAEIGFLRRVHEEELDDIEDPLRVSILPVCITDDFGLMRQDGNAGALRQIIADNDAMTEALFRKDFNAEDVVGVRMTDDDAVLLYVHPFYKR